MEYFTNVISIFDASLGYILLIDFEEWIRKSSPDF